jgi:hypothetical protein
MTLDANPDAINPKNNVAGFFMRLFLVTGGKPLTERTIFDLDCVEPSRPTPSDEL